MKHLSTFDMKNSLSTGSTLLNLACSGDPNGGFLAGHYYYLVGDSDSGKTFFSMTCMAEATLNPDFKTHRLIYDNVEDGMLMDLDQLFNEEVADRIEPPRLLNDEPVFSSTIEEFYFHLDDALKDGRPFIYVLDSMDGLDSVAAGEKFDKTKKAARRAELPRKDREGEEDEKVAGSYGDGKAKKNSEFLRKAMKPLRDSGSILIIISQTRDSLEKYGQKKTRSGGHALAFYATMQIWTAVAEKLRKNVHNKARDVGSRIVLSVRRNRITGKRHSIEVDIFPSFGIDDLGSCVDYLVEEKWWDQTGQKINAKELGIHGTREKIIRLVEKRGLEEKLREICGQCWRQVEEACSLKRKNRYAPQTKQNE